ncbi:MAG: response regulator [Planctomycetes bacterium]|nr:response regulator [Planctomycetota bacterium]
MKPDPGPGLAPGSAVVLIADNDPGVNALLGEVLAMRGVASESVLDGEAALQRLHRGGVRLLICDLDMPRLDGLGLLEQLALLPDPPAVVVVSGYVHPRVEGGLRANPVVRGIYAKPFDVVRFGDDVVEILRGAAG